MTAPTPIEDLLKAMTRMPPAVYPGYIAMRIKAAFKLPGNLVDPERVVASVSDMETVGDCRYRITLRDFNGSVYRVTVEMDDACSKSAELREGLSEENAV